jgi:hypothetical protein
MRYSIGIDNGFKGAIVLLDENFQIVSWHDTPCINLTKKGKGGKLRHQHEFAPSAMKKILMLTMSKVKISSDIHVWLEAAQSMPGQGLSSTFKTGRGFGIWEGLVTGIGLRYDIVHSRTWTKFMLKDVPLGDPKQRTLIKAQRLFGESLPLTKPNGSVLSMDGRADAALMAYYGMSQMLGSKSPTVIKKPIPKRK